MEPFCADRAELGAHLAGQLTTINDERK